MSSSIQLLQTFPIKIHIAGPTTFTISTFLMFPQSFPGNFPNSSHPKIMSAFLSFCLQLLSILKIHAIGRGPPATISNLISSTYYRKNRKSDPENQNYPTWFPIRIHFTHDQKNQKSLKKCPPQLSPILTSRCPMKIPKVSFIYYVSTKLNLTYKFLQKLFFSSKQRSLFFNITFWRNFHSVVWNL